eukprot:GHVQ01008104.1.p2 GENE.GHVQ01008104.1~~GHVQ01008104.1.p2  ORF type:complete len:102 (-),score=6.47 GHVQ01008104.1:452-757(-)
MHTYCLHISHVHRNKIDIPLGDSLIHILWTECECTQSLYVHSMSQSLYVHSMSQSLYVHSMSQSLYVHSMSQSLYVHSMSQSQHVQFLYMRYQQSIFRLSL